MPSTNISPIPDTLLEQKRLFYQNQHALSILMGGRASFTVKSCHLQDWAHLNTSRQGGGRGSDLFDMFL